MGSEVEPLETNRNEPFRANGPVDPPHIAAQVWIRMSETCLAGCGFRAFRIVFNALVRLTYLAKLSKKSLRGTLTMS